MSVFDRIPVSYSEIHLKRTVLFVERVSKVLQAIMNLGNNLQKNRHSVLNLWFPFALLFPSLHQLLSVILYQKVKGGLFSVS